ncbi:MAG: pyridoxamine 5'-phosphate oxidase family protein [Tepidiformaceae bacterium]
MDVQSFAEIEPELMARVRPIVWCTVTTVDRRGRPRARILHPMWEGSTAFIMTGRQSFKTKHLEQNPYVSLSYWSVEHGLAYAECKAEWRDDAAEKRRVWELFKTTPPPYGYDPAMFFKSADDPGFGVLRCTPWRVEVHSLAELATGTPSRVWRP